MRQKTDGLLDFTVLKVCAVKILAEIRSTGKLHMPGLLLDKHRRGALAELESTGAIRAVGVGNAHGDQPYEIAPDRETAHAWHEAVMKWPVGRVRRQQIEPFMLFEDTMPDAQKPRIR